MIKFRSFHDYRESYLLLLDEKCGTFLMLHLHLTDIYVPSVAYVYVWIWDEVHLMGYASGNLVVCILFEK